MADKENMRIQRIHFAFLIALFTSLINFLESSEAKAERAAEVRVNKPLVYRGKIVRPDGILPAGSVSAKVFQIRD